MEKTGKQRHLYFVRVSENCQLLTELYVVPDELNHQQGWFEDKHLQEIILLLRDPIKAKVVSYYEQRRRKKWPGVQEGNDSKKKPVEDEHQITTGQSVKIGYRFVDSNLHHHSCLLPTKLGTPVWKDDNSKHAGGGFIPARLFAKKLMVFVCKYHPANIGQTTSQLMRSMCATPPSKHIAISSYFAPKADDDFVPPVTESANMKRNRLRKIVKGKNTAAAVGSKENSDNRKRLKGGGFFEKDLADADTETAKEIKREDEQYPSVSDMDCNSDGLPDVEEKKDRLDGDPRSTECKDGESFTGAGQSSSGRPLSPQEEKLLEVTVNSHMKPDEYDNKVDGRDHSNQSDVSKPFVCKLENMEQASKDSQKEADVPSSEGTSSLPFYRNLNDSLKSIKSEVTEQLSSVGQESGVTKLTWTSEVTESSPSSSGDFDNKPRRQDTKSRNKLSLKRGETKKGSASKVRSSMEKVLHEDAIKESAEEVSVDLKVHTEIGDSSILTLQLHKVAVNEKATTHKIGSNISKTVGHASSNCSVVLKDIKSNLGKSWNESSVTKKSPLKRPLTNQPEISSPDKETTPNSSSDDDLMSASFLYTEKRPMEVAEEVKESRHQSPVRAPKYENRRRNDEMDSACNSSEPRDIFHSTVNAFVENTENNENPRRRGLKQSKLTLSNRQKNICKDEVHGITKQPSHGEKRGGQRNKIQKLMEDLDWDSDSQGTSQIERTSKVMNSHKVRNRVKDDAPDEPMEVEDALPETTPVVEVECLSDEVEALSSFPCRPDDDRETSIPELKQDNLVDISDDSCGGDARETKQAEEGGSARGGASQEGKHGDLDDEVIDLSQGFDDEDESDGWFEDQFGNVRLVTELKVEDIASLTQRNKKYLHNIFQGKVACERHQCYKKKGPHRVGMASNVRLGPFSEEQMDAVMGELVKVYCAKHFKYMDYLSKVLLPEAMTKIYMDVHGVSHNQAEEVMKGMQKEHPRTTHDFT